MALLTQFASFFVSPLVDDSACDELNNFIRSHRVVNVEKYKMENNRGTGLLFLIEYGSEVKSKFSSSQPRIDYRETLNEQERALYDNLLDLRKATADNQGIPVYAVFTNEQLATMVKKPPLNIKDILALPNVGESRAKQFGETFLNAFNNISGLQLEAP